MVNAVEKVSVVLFVLMILLMASTGHAKSLNDYIGKTCSKAECVKPTLLIKAVKEASKKYKVDPRLLLSIAKVESTFKTKAKSGSNVGLMQVNLRYHRSKFAKTNPFDINKNVMVGTSIYKECLVRMKGNVSRALGVCYNGNGTPGYGGHVLKVYNKLKQYTF